MHARSFLKLYTNGSSNYEYWPWSQCVCLGRVRAVSVHHRVEIHIMCYLETKLTQVHVWVILGNLGGPRKSLQTPHTKAGLPQPCRPTEPPRNTYINLDGDMNKLATTISQHTLQWTKNMGLTLVKRLKTTLESVVIKKSQCKTRGWGKHPKVVKYTLSGWMSSYGKCCCSGYSSRFRAGGTEYIVFISIHFWKPVYLHQPPQLYLHEHHHASKVLDSTVLTKALLIPFKCVTANQLNFAHEKQQHQSNGRVVWWAEDGLLKQTIDRNAIPMTSSGRCCRKKPSNCFYTFQWFACLSVQNKLNLRLGFYESYGKEQAWQKLINWVLSLKKSYDKENQDAIWLTEFVLISIQTFTSWKKNLRQVLFVKSLIWVWDAVGG